MAALPHLITVDEYRKLPEDGEFVYELHNGVVVPVSRPKVGHWRLQKRVARLLDSKLSGYEIGTELSFRAVPEFDLRAADVAAVTPARFDAIDEDDNLRGAPELVIEVKSPSNTRQKLLELVSLCLNHGALECWIVDSRSKSVTVTHRVGTTVVYTSGQSVPLAAFGSDSIAVDEIFA